MNSSVYIGSRYHALDDMNPEASVENESVTIYTLLLAAVLSCQSIGMIHLFDSA